MQVLHQGSREPRLRGLAALAAVCALVLAVVFPAQAQAATTSGHEPVTAEVPVTVSLAGDKASATERFSFEMTPADDASAAPAESLVTVDGAGTASFSLTFDRVGEHHYTVRQVAGTADNWTYDGQTYDVTVYCMWDEATDTLFTKVIVEDSDGYKAESCAFENTYDAPASPEKPAAQKPAGGTPSTGDTTNWGTVAGLLCAGVVVVAVAAWCLCRASSNAPSGSSGKE